MAKKKVTEVVEEILAPFLREGGYELYHTEFLKEGGDWFLRVYIDKPSVNGEESYISTEDCETVSRYLSEKLDEEDPVTQNYYLEVSSPGMDRPLITPTHYSRAVGKMIEIRLYKGVDGSKKYTGLLKEVDEDHLTLETEEGKELHLNMTEIAKAKMAIVL